MGHHSTGRWSGEGGRGRKGLKLKKICIYTNIKSGSERGYVQPASARSAHIPSVSSRNKWHDNINSDVAVLVTVAAVDGSGAAVMAAVRW